jgi:RND family efflux transporter MFP subunit
VSGFLTEIKYTDGMPVKKGQHLFTIEPEPYQLKLQQAQAAEQASQATVIQTQADFDRQQELVQRQAASKAAFDNSTANRDNAKAKILQAQADTKQAQINLDYTRVVAPFDGVVTARQVSVGELVGGSGTQVLATIVQLDPIYVNFAASERDVLHVRDMLYKRGQKASDLLGADIEVGLQTDPGYPHKGKLDYIAPTVNQGTGTLMARAELRNANRLMLPGFFVRVRVPLEETPALLVPSVALGADQGGRYVLVVNGENVVEQRKVEVGPTVGELTVIESGLKADDRVVTAGLLRAIPGQKVDPQTRTADAR